MKGSLTATTLLLALSAQAQVSGPNRPGPGTSPGTFQTPGAVDSSIQVTTPDSAAISTTRPIANPVTGPQPRTSAGSPDATAGALGDSLRSRSTFPSSRDWETGAGTTTTTPGLSSDTRRLTPPPDATPNLPTVRGTGSIAPRGTGTIAPQTTTTINGSSVGATSPTSPVPAMPSDLNATGVNTPPRAPEQPLDRALSAKIRAQLSQMPSRGNVRLAPEIVRDMRITSQGGKVILEGSVDNPAERQLVEVQARRVPGVVAVENRLMVRNYAVGAPGASQSGSARDRIDGSPNQPPVTPPLPITP